MTHFCAIAYYIIVGSNIHLCMFYFAIKFGCQSILLLELSISLLIIYFYGLSALVGCWSSAFRRRIMYKFLNACPFDYTAFAVSGKVGVP